MTCIIHFLIRLCHFINDKNQHLICLKMCLSSPSSVNSNKSKSSSIKLKIYIILKNQNHKILNIYPKFWKS